MSTKRTRQDWLALIKDQQSSGLTIAAYAKRHGISLQHFYTRRSELRSEFESASGSQFIRVTTVEQQHVSSTLSLQVGQCQLQLPTTVDPTWLGTLLKASA